ncbi:HepT-like ribonuclease domain-containing protein [Leptolyngbya sp. NIES-2104]|uniref:HepT-like ribonuclease domain-containing protein n=1 Tax=Leptolyngbya sp. NIES-2104 TaxID=1552121 RepID=UPI00073E2312|nr:DUF86 domain-containing protein [Leptolyngbya sp. NIES-2104]
MSRNIRLYLEDMVKSCEKILRYTNAMTFEEFLSDELRYDAVIRNLEILGEAAKKVPQDLRNRSPETEWRNIAGLRDIIAHAYFQIRDEIIWDTVQNKIQPLKIQIENLLAQEFDEQ